MRAIESIIQGKCYCCGDGTTVYQVIPEERWTMNRIDSAEMGRWVFESLEPGAAGVPNHFKSLGLTIVAAGKDFGCGSKSVEHPMAALKGAGVQLVLAESFSRYSYRNAINLGLPVLTCPGITRFVSRGDELSADLLTGRIDNLTTGVSCQAEDLGEFALNILHAGGILNYLEQEGVFRIE